MPHLPRSLRRITPGGTRAAVAAVATLLLGACGDGDPVSVSDGGSRTIPARVGLEIVVTLQTVGPGEYASPPSVSSPSVRFLDVSQADVAVPAGPTQRFRFLAVSRGRAVITFRHTAQARVVEDTVDVR
jgi:hypothetical protein